MSSRKLINLLSLHGKINKNEFITDKLKALADIRRSQREMHRYTAYINAIRVISSLPFKVTNISQVKNLNGIGKGIEGKIDELLKTNKIEELEKLSNDTEILGVKKLQTIMGVGPQLAKKWVLKGIYDINNVKNAVKNGEIELNNMQKLGLKYYDDLNERLSRKEVEELGGAIINVIHSVAPKADAIIAGSYRRGKPTVGDIDILLICPNLLTKEQVDSSDILVHIANVLKKHDLITALLNTVKKGSNKITAISKLPNKKYKKQRRVDIRLLPANSKASALLYFTGSKVNNELMRTFARRRGFTLNEYGLFKLDINGEVGEQVPAKTEKDIYNILGLKYQTPKQRDTEK